MITQEQRDGFSRVTVLAKKKNVWKTFLDFTTFVRKMHDVMTKHGFLMRIGEDASSLKMFWARTIARLSILAFSKALKMLAEAFKTKHLVCWAKLDVWFPLLLVTRCRLTMLLKLGGPKKYFVNQLPAMHLETILGIR